MCMHVCICVHSGWVYVLVKQSYMCRGLEGGKSTQGRKQQDERSVSREEVGGTQS